MLLVIKRASAFLFLMAALGMGALYLAYTGLPEKEITPVSPQNNPQQLKEMQNALPVLNPAGLSSTNNGGLDDGSKVENFFVDFKMTRDSSRSRQIELLRETINNPSSDPDIRKKAQEQMLDLSQDMAQEKEVEGLIQAKGYHEAVVCLEQGGVTVVVRAEQLKQDDVYRISDLVARGTGVGESGIVIIPKH